MKLSCAAGLAAIMAVVGANQYVSAESISVTAIPQTPLNPTAPAGDSAFVLEDFSPFTQTGGAAPSTLVPDFDLAFDWNDPVHFLPESFKMSFGDSAFASAQGSTMADPSVPSPFEYRFVAPIDSGLNSRQPPITGGGNNRLDPDPGFVAQVPSPTAALGGLFLIGFLICFRRHY